MQKYHESILAKQSGFLIPAAGATATIKTHPAGAVATIYSDDGVTPKTNPFAIGSEGVCEFYAADGRYTLEITGGGFASSSVVDILLDDDEGAADLSADDGAGGTLWTTIQGFINKIISSAGSSVIGFIQAGTGSGSRKISDKLAESVSVLDKVADPTGVASSSTAFANAAASAATVVVPDGTYLLATDVTATSTFVFGANVTLTGAGILYAPVNRPQTATYPARRKTLGDVFKKAQGGSGITIACYGDSITYGQDTSGTGVATQINGASQTRSPYPFPEKLQEALGFCGFAVAPTVINRGYPGDSTIEGITRWASASATDVAFVMYGHNDAKNYGGYGHGPLTIADFRRNLSIIIEREIVKGAAVIVLGPPPVYNDADNELIRTYVAAARELAEQYALPFVDTEELISTVTVKWSDQTHLAPAAYNEIGWMLAALFLRRDTSSHCVAPGDIYYEADKLGHGGALSVWASAKAGGGTLIALTAGQTYAIGVYVEEDVQPVIHCVNSSGVSFTLNAYYAGATNISLPGLTHDQTFGTRQKLLAPILRRGYRTLMIRNDGANTGFIEAIEFQDMAAPHYSRGLLSKSKALSGVSLPARIAAGSTWNCIADYSRRVTDPCGLVAWLTLTDAGSNKNNGLAILRDRPLSSQAEFFSAYMLMVLRVGTSLVLRQLINGAPDTDTTLTSVFSAGAFTGEIEIALSAGTMSVYVNGTLAGSRAVAQTSGFAALIGEKDSRPVCYALAISGEVKSVY